MENLAPCKKLLRVEVDAQTVEQAFETATADFQRKGVLPGFRAGKAPRERIAKVFARQIEADVKKKLYNETFKNALQKLHLQALGKPEIEEIQFGRTLGLQYAVTLETEPEFELPDYKGLPVRLTPAAVTQADVERALTVLREQRATYHDVSRPAQTGDFVVIHYQGACAGKPIIEIVPTARALTEQKNYWLRLEPDAFLPGFSEQLVGAQAGERRTVEVNFPADFVESALAGQQGSYAVELLQIKERRFPELNEEFAKAYGAESLDKLREGVRKDLQNELNYKQNNTLRDQLLRALLDRVTCELPESIVQAETRNVVIDIVRENQQRGIAQEAIDERSQEIYSYASSNAKERVKTAFVLNRIAQKEGLQASREEVNERILKLAQQYQIKPEKFVKQLQERNGIAEIEEQIVNAKVIELLQNHAKIIEEGSLAR